MSCCAFGSGLLRGIYPPTAMFHSIFCMLTTIRPFTHAYTLLAYLDPPPPRPGTFFEVCNHPPTHTAFTHPDPPPPLPPQELDCGAHFLQSMDTDNSGTITADELREAMKKQGSPLVQEELQRLLESIDVDATGRYNLPVSCMPPASLAKEAGMGSGGGGVERQECSR